MLHLTGLLMLPSKPRINGKEQVNGILGRASDAGTTTKEMNLLGSVGDFQSVVVNTMGIPAAQALGFSATKDGA